MKKFMSLIFVFMFLFTGVTVYADEKGEVDDLGYILPPRLKVVYSVDELSEYLSTYRIEYAKDKNFCTYREHSPKMGEFYNTLDYIYLPRNVDPKLITEIDLCVYDVYICFKKSENSTENTQIRWMFSEDPASLGFSIERFSDSDTIKQTGLPKTIKYRQKEQPIAYDKFLTLYDFGLYDIKLAYVSDFPIVSHGFPIFPEGRDIAPDESLDVGYDYDFASYGYYFWLTGNMPEREKGYKYCDLVKIPLNITTDISAGESVEECSILLC